ncbi:MAG: hypothetical protein WB780_13485 [Candidatus Acidiferrales bacterium]
MDATGLVKVLLVGERPQEFLASRQLAEWNGCQCHFAKSRQEVAELSDLWKFDIVLSNIRIHGESIDWLVRLFSGSRANFFYSLRVEESYWWLPVLSLGKECLGTPGLRPNEFIRVLDRLIKRIKTNTTT